MPVDVHGRPLVPQRVPELEPTPLQSSFIYLSILVLICGVIAIAALELVGGITLLAVTLDALVRVWRSIGAWWDVDRGRALFRVVWVLVIAASLVVIGAIMFIVLTA